MFRSGRLTRTRLNSILEKAARNPHNLKAVAKACMIYPADLLAWYAAGQDPDCRDPLMVELAWKIAELRFEKSTENYERIVAAANGGKKTKTTEKIGPTGEPSVEQTVEDVLPAAWAIEKIDQLSKESPWEISPNAEQAADLQALMSELTPTPLLTDGPDQPLSQLPAPEGDGEPSA